MAAQLEIEDQESVTNVDNGDNFESLSDHADSGLPRLSSGDSMTLLLPGNLDYDIITTCFLSGMGPLASDTTVVTVRKNSTEEVTTKAKFLVFRVFTEAMVRKNSGNANVKYGWYSGSKEEINSIISYGFSSREIEKFDNDTRSHGIGIHLFPHTYSLAGAVAAEPDEEGIRYLLLCRLILGNPEPVISGSKQSHPSAIQFDSGVDNLQNPRKYVIWSSTMNSYILPSYVVSFRSPRLQCNITRSTRARSPFVSFSVLMSILSNSLDPPRMNMILTTFNDFRKRKLRKDQLVRLLREVVGDNLLLDIIKNQRNWRAPTIQNKFT